MGTIRDGKGSSVEAHVDDTGALKVSDRSPFGVCDEIVVTYPTTTSEVYTYKLRNDSIGTITVSYLTSSKVDVSSVIYDEL